MERGITESLRWIVRLMRLRFLVGEAHFTAQQSLYIFLCSSIGTAPTLHFFSSPWQLKHLTLSPNPVTNEKGRYVAISV